MQRREGQVLQLPLDVGDAKAVGQRGVNVERLLSRTLLAGLGHGRQRAHVMEPVAQFYEQNSWVFGHGDEHLAHRRRLRGGTRVERDPLQFGHAVHNLGDHGAEVCFEVRHRQGGVLYGVVQQRSRQRDVVHPEAGQDGGHGQWVRDERLAGTADLALMGTLGRLVRLQDQALVAPGMALAKGLQQRAERFGLRLALTPPRQDALHRGCRLAS